MRSIGCRSARGRQTELLCQILDSGAHIEVASDSRLAISAEPPPYFRAADHPLERRREGSRIGRRDENPALSVLDQLGKARQRGRDAGEFLAMGFEQNIRQAVAVAVP